MIGVEGCEADTAPVEQIVRYGDRDARAVPGKCRVSHHIVLQRLDIDDARVFAPAAVSDSS